MVGIFGPHKRFFAFKRRPGGRLPLNGSAPAMRLQLNFAAGGYDFVRPLTDGMVKADGIDLIVLGGMGSGERHYRIGHGQEFDLCEFKAVPRCARARQDDGS